MDTITTEAFSICYISLSYFPGQGVARLIENSRSLARMGHQVHVIAAAKAGEKKFEVVDGVQVQRIPIKSTKRWSLENIHFMSLATRCLSRLMNTQPIDIVHVFAYTGSFPLRLIRIILRSSKRTKWFYDIRTDSISPNRVIRWIDNTLKRFETSLYDGVFIIDEAIRDLALNNKIFAAPIGVDLKLFRNTHDRSLLSKYGVKKEDVVFVYLGSLHPYRRVDRLIQAFALASRRVKNLWLLILGEGADLNRLESLAEKLIPGRVLFMGYIDYRRVPDFLSVADVGISFVPIVLAYDNQPPQKTIEYLACSLPVVATSTRGNKRLITNEKNGLLVKDDPFSFSRALIKLSLDTDLRKSLAQRARPSVEAYDSKRIASRFLLPAYQKVLKS